MPAGRPDVRARSGSRFPRRKKLDSPMSIHSDPIWPVSAKFSWGSFAPLAEGHFPDTFARDPNGRTVCLPGDIADPISCHLRLLERPDHCQRVVGHPDRVVLPDGNAAGGAYLGSIASPELGLVHDPAIEVQDMPPIALTPAADDNALKGPIDTVHLPVGLLQFGQLHAAVPFHDDDALVNGHRETPIRKRCQSSRPVDISLHQQSPIVRAEAPDRSRVADPDDPAARGDVVRVRNGYAIPRSRHLELPSLPKPRRLQSVQTSIATPDREKAAGVGAVGHLVAVSDLGDQPRS